MGLLNRARIRLTSPSTAVSSRSGTSISLWPRAGIFTYAVKSPVQFPVLLLTTGAGISQARGLMMTLCGLPGGGTLCPASPLPSSQLWVLFILYKQLIMGAGTGSHTALNRQVTESFSFSLAQLLYWNTVQRFQQMRWWKVRHPHGLQPLIWTFSANTGVIHPNPCFKLLPHLFISLSQPPSLSFSLVRKQRGGTNPKFCRLYRCLDCVGITQIAKWVHGVVLVHGKVNSPGVAQAIIAWPCRPVVQNVVSQDSIIICIICKVPLGQCSAIPKSIPKRGVIITNHPPNYLVFPTKNILISY